MRHHAVIWFLAVTAGVAAFRAVGASGSAFDPANFQSKCRNCSSVPTNQNGLLENVAVYGAFDDRLLLQPSQLGPLAAVGRVSVKPYGGAERQGGTAFLVSPCHVVTEAHAVIDGIYRGDSRQPWRPPRPFERITFQIGDTSTGQFADSTEMFRITDSRGRFTASGNPNFNGPARCGDDWEILRLDVCLGEKYGFLPMTNGNSYLDEAVGGVREKEMMAVGYDAALPLQKGIVLDPKCQNFNYRLMNRDGSEAGWFTSCGINPGMSGGPIVTRDLWPAFTAMACANDKFGFAMDSGHRDYVRSMGSPTEITKRGQANGVTRVDDFMGPLNLLLQSDEETDYIQRRTQKPYDYNLMGLKGGVLQHAPSRPAPLLEKNTRDLRDEIKQSGH